VAARALAAIADLLHGSREQASVTGSTGAMALDAPWLAPQIEQLRRARAATDFPPGC
jgi:hypothetical protein